MQDRTSGICCDVFAILIVLLVTDYIVIAVVSVCTRFSTQLVPDDALLASKIQCYDTNSPNGAHDGTAA